MCSVGANAYLYGLGRVAEQASSTWTYYHLVAHGSTCQLSDSTDTLTLGQSYEPFGDKLSSAGSGGMYEVQDAGGTNSIVLRWNRRPARNQVHFNHVNTFTLPPQSAPIMIYYRTVVLVWSFHIV